METSIIIETIVKAIVILAVFSAIAGFTTYIERKILAFMQRRLGPTNVGPYGLLQIVCDGIKLFTKEDFIPQNAVKPIFMIAPIITAATAFIAMTAVPFFPEFEVFGYTIRPIIADINVGVLFVMGVASVGLYGPLLAGMSSGNKWALLGGARTAIQLLSYEVVSGLALLAPLMLVGSLSLIDINEYQSAGFTSWIIWTQPLAFILFVMAGFAETNRTPFDLLEHEAEIVAGYATEYSGMRWGMFFIGEYANLFTISFLISLIFLGGYNDLWFIPGGLAIILKVSFLIFFFLWTRASWPHVRPDQLMWLCWKILMPLAVVNILLTGAFVMIVGSLG
ncbi:NADH dehydrogenase (quinone) [Arcobacter nitrofigilis DSM 7299]|uniref:NADH-quinone oxidoreductase subunit H n=1 Tax=Arcobacter nitrofigilis (strain ATCC 33309 / DSM 7299 / CCUG 15893 / LMG 7604 / NCTC 12251 / CI) TaxID=572480 RepID=D5V7K0_ARCNC|nr:NADH-quinone oxidoreductase subunit NuoH [Arcobacter nitrofigilis]ADG94620.1 NADH dehydrogenase (quinone) [Arcobacter nitrofigilis DSM 7299]